LYKIFPCREKDTSFGAPEEDDKWSTDGNDVDTNNRKYAGCKMKEFESLNLK
jgi:hypothetical protein